MKRRKFRVGGVVITVKTNADSIHKKPNSDVELSWKNKAK